MIVTRIHWRFLNCLKVTFIIIKVISDIILNEARGAGIKFKDKCFDFPKSHAHLMRHIRGDEDIYCEQRRVYLLKASLACQALLGL